MPFNPSSKRRQPNSANEKRASLFMRQVDPIKGFENIQNVFDQLNATQCNAAPVIDEVGHCIGILTFTDVQRYKEAQDQCDDGDLHALDAVVEVDSSGTRRICIDSFDEVHRHMTTPVITIDVAATSDDALAVFKNHPEIHHLVVVDDKQRPVGILESQDLQTAEQDDMHD